MVRAYMENFHANMNKFLKILKFLKLMKFINLSDAGWCTPTILVAILGIIAIVTLCVQLATEKNDTTRKEIIWAIVSALIITLVMGFVMFYLCSQGKIEAAKWLFYILYLIPLAFVFVTMAGVMIKQSILL